MHAVPATLRDAFDICPRWPLSGMTSRLLGYRPLETKLLRGCPASSSRHPRRGIVGELDRQPWGARRVSTASRAARTEVHTAFVIGCASIRLSDSATACPRPNEPPIHVARIHTIKNPGSRKHGGPFPLSGVNSLVENEDRLGSSPRIVGRFLRAPPLRAGLRVWGQRSPSRPRASRDCPGPRRQPRPPQPSQSAQSRRAAPPASCAASPQQPGGADRL